MTDTTNPTPSAPPSASTAMSARPMKRQVRIALMLFVAALALGWLGLRRSNAALEDALATSAHATSVATKPGVTP